MELYRSPLAFWGLTHSYAPPLSSGLPFHQVWGSSAQHPPLNTARTTRASDYAAVNERGGRPVPGLHRWHQGRVQQEQTLRGRLVLRLRDRGGPVHGQGLDLSDVRKRRTTELRARHGRLREI